MITSLSILIRDYCDREAKFVPLTYFTKQIAFANTMSKARACHDCTKRRNDSHARQPWSNIEARPHGTSSTAFCPLF